MSLRLPGHRRQLTRALTAGAARGCAFGLIAGYGVKLAASLTGGRPLWLMGSLAGAAIGLGFALVSWARTAAPSGEAASPRSTLRADRALVLLLPIPARRYLRSHLLAEDSQVVGVLEESGQAPG